MWTELLHKKSVSLSIFDNTEIRCFFSDKGFSTNDKGECTILYRLDLVHVKMHWNGGWNQEVANSSKMPRNFKTMDNDHTFIMK